MTLDGATIGALLGFLGLVVTASSGIYIATLTNRKEKEDSALKAFEETRDEAYEARMQLKDDQINRLKEDLEDERVSKKIRVEELESELDKEALRNSKLEAENKTLKDELARLKET